MQQDLVAITQATAYDQSGAKIGKIDQLYVDDETSDPLWLTVHAGWFGSTKAIPYEGAVLDGRELKVVPTKDAVKHSPELGKNDIGEEFESDLCRYYQLPLPEDQLRKRRADVAAVVDNRTDEQHELAKTSQELQDRYAPDARSCVVLEGSGGAISGTAFGTPVEQEASSGARLRRFA
ncbi:PRC-barrel domain-containing protein [Antrihabitans stalagmiti]|nr:PRC-barrel domain-containing protein [Antrihabitans stalagmiti]